MPEPTTHKLSHYFTHSKRKGMAGLPLASVTMNDGLVLRTDMDRKMETSLSSEEHSLVEPGDIAYNMMRMWQGAFGLASAPVNVSPAYVVLRAKANLEPRFAAQWLKSDRALYLLWAYSYGITDDRLRLYPKEFLQIPVAWPDRTEQRRIAAVLDAWDEAIATCEKLVAAKARLLALLREELLFGLEESQKVLRDVALVRTGVPAPQDAPAFAKNGPRFVRVNDLIAFAGEAKHSPEYLNVDFAKAAKLKLFPTGTILFAKSGMSASLGRVVALSEPAHIVSHLCAVNAKYADCQRFLFHWLTYLPPSSLIQGDGFPSIRKSEVEEMPFPDISEKVALSIAAILDEAKATVAESKALASLLRTQKRGLMQKLLTGQWRVPESVEALMPGGGV